MQTGLREALLLMQSLQSRRGQFISGLLVCDVYVYKNPPKVQDEGFGQSQAGSGSEKELKCSASWPWKALLGRA